MKVYLIEESGWDHHEVLGVYSTYEKAQAALSDHAPTGGLIDATDEATWLSLWGWLDIIEREVDE